MKEFLILLGWLSLAGSVLGLAVTAIGRLSHGRLNRAFCCALWVLVLLRLFVPFAAPQVLGTNAPFARLQARLHTAQTAPVLPQTGEAAAPAPDAPQQSAPASTAPPAGSAAPQTDAAQGTVHGSTETVPGTAAGTPEGHTQTGGLHAGDVLRALRTDLPQTLFWIWLGAAGFRLLWLMCGYHSFRRRVLRRAVPAPQELRTLFAGLYAGSRLRLVCSPEAHTALLLGLQNPVLVLPQHAPMLQNRDAAEAVLRHELAHYRRGDLWLKWAAAAAGCLHWFNPLAWLMQREVNRACELACDEAVIRTMTAKEKQIYGETLIAFAGRQGRTAVPLTAICEYKQQLKERLVCIMKYRKRNLLSVLACCCLLALLCGCAAALGPTNETPDAPVTTPAESIVESEPAESTPEETPETPTTPEIPTFDVEKMKSEATVLTVGDITNEYVRTDIITPKFDGKIDWVYTNTWTLTGDRLWVYGYERPENEADWSIPKIASFNIDGSDVRLTTLVRPELDTTLYGALPEGYEWSNSVSTLVDCGGDRPLILRSVSQYGPNKDGYINLVGGYGYYLCSFDDSGVVTEGIPLAITVGEGWFMEYICSTPGTLWCRVDRTGFDFTVPYKVVGFSMEDGSLLHTFELPESAWINDAQGLADGRVVLELVSMYKSDEYHANVHNNSYQYVIADPTAGTLSKPILPPEHFGAFFQSLLKHPLCDMPEDPSVFFPGFALYNWDMETGELCMTAEWFSFGSNIDLNNAAIFPLSDGRHLVLEYGSTRLVIAEPYPLEG